jgi:dTDP-4-amino-4,6-dideoxygalactose transaminase
MKVPFLHFPAMHESLKQDMMAAFEKVYDRNWFVLGTEVEGFEKEYAAFNQVNHAIGVSNGLDALHLSLQAMGVGYGDEVIVPSNTFIATVLAVSYVGATPVFVEPSLEYYNLDPQKIEAAITPKTKAIMPVHLYGQACEMQEIMGIAEKHKLIVIEDNAQSQGALSGGKMTGSFGHVNATSFYPGKNLGALGDAGGVTTNDEKLAQQVKMLSNYGSAKKYVHDSIGYNMRMDELQAAFLRIKLHQLNTWIAQRQQIAKWYNTHLAACSSIILPAVQSSVTHTYHLFVIRTSQRDALQQQLSNNEISTLIHYPIPPHLQDAYQNLGHKKGDFPIAELLADTSLSLPIWPGMTEEHVAYVANSIIRFFNP